jgi:hypothetical protein
MREGANDERSHGMQHLAGNAGERHGPRRRGTPVSTIVDQETERRRSRARPRRPDNAARSAAACGARTSLPPHGPAPRSVAGSATARLGGVSGETP